MERNKLRKEANQTKRLGELKGGKKKGKMLKGRWQNSRCAKI